MGEFPNMLQPRVRDLVTPTQVQFGELRELVANVPQPRVRDVTAMQVQASEVFELDNVPQPRVRDVTVMQVQASEVFKSGNVL